MAAEIVPHSFQRIEVPQEAALPRSLDAALADGWTVAGQSSHLQETFRDAGAIHLRKQLDAVELRCVVNYAVYFSFERPKNLSAFVLVNTDPREVERGGITIYRVTAWDPNTTNCFNVGLFTAHSRAHAIRKAQVPAYRSMVLDAVEVAFTKGNL